MKVILFTTLLVLSLPAFSAFNEVECKVKQENKEIYLEVEQPFPSGSSFRRSSLVVTENGVESIFENTLTVFSSRGFNRLRYVGGGLNLEIDLWPDNRPQWGRNYRSILRSSELGNNEIRNVNCTFPNAY